MRNGAVLAAAVMLSMLLALSPLPSFAKKWTVTEHLEHISRDIEEGRKANELTVKQVEGLKQDVVSIQAKMEKMKQKNGGKLSIPDTKKLHQDLTDLSVKTLKTRLNNVYKS